MLVHGLACNEQAMGFISMVFIKMCFSLCPYQISIELLYVDLFFLGFERLGQEYHHLFHLQTKLK